MSFVRDWDGKEFETEEDAYEDYLDNLYLYDDEFIENFFARVSSYKFLKWAVAQPSFDSNFYTEYEQAMTETFNANYIDNC